MSNLDDLGFAALDAVLSEVECDRLLAAISQPLITRSRAGARHILRIPAIAQLANDDRLLGFVRSILGPRAVAFRATLFDKCAASNWSVFWHQDTALPLAGTFDRSGWGPWSVKAGVAYAHAPASALSRVLALRVHLDPSMLDNGPLRVIAGSHRLGVLPDDEVSAMAHASAPVDCVICRGGILAMRPLLVHASERVASPVPRRVLHLEFAEEWEVAPGVMLAAA